MQTLPYHFDVRLFEKNLIGNIFNYHGIFSEKNKGEGEFRANGWVDILSRGRDWNRDHLVADLGYITASYDARPVLKVPGAFFSKKGNFTLPFLKYSGPSSNQ